MNSPLYLCGGCGQYIDPGGAVQHMCAPRGTMWVQPTPVVGAGPSWVDFQLLEVRVAEMAVKLEELMALLKKEEQPGKAEGQPHEEVGN